MDECYPNLVDLDHKNNPESKHKGIYIGQKSRTLAERAKEHRDSLRNFEFKSFKFKHWSQEHKESEKPPEFIFSVIKANKDATKMLY